MHPAGHLATTVPLTGGVYLVTGSIPMTVGTFLGGFLIDVDHYFDYFVINRQFNLDPRHFLDYFINCRFHHIVLPLHSYELFVLLAWLGWFLASPWIVGFMIGLTLHMTLDLFFNEGSARAIIPFYSFAYRARHGFSKLRLIRDDAGRNR